MQEVVLHGRAPHGANPLVGEEHHHPAHQQRLQLGVVEALRQKHQVRAALDVAVPHTVLDLARQLRQDGPRQAAVPVLRQASAGVRRVKHGVQQVPGHPPPQARGGHRCRGVAPRCQACRGAGEVERLALAQRPVELALEGVQHEVHLVQHGHPRPEQGKDLAPDGHLPPQGRHVRGVQQLRGPHPRPSAEPQLLEVVQQPAGHPAGGIGRHCLPGSDVALGGVGGEGVGNLHDLEHQALHRGGVGDHYGAGFPSGL
mmetsp:Transcript_1032/g.3139  ORF Transcript_1032/g.3139 Transcript_1032/m.3139 type:complete len:257 (-) Transcript_1032:153-923(-)